MRNEYQIRECTDPYLREIYDWSIKERDTLHFTCRPLNQIGPFEAWRDDLMQALSAKRRILRLLFTTRESTRPLGRFNGFDINPRNRSLEIGFYFPPENRGKGYGFIGLTLFLNMLFEDAGLDLNKAYATTSGNNAPAVSLLEKACFHRDGENREHYWIDGGRYPQYVYSLLRREWETVRASASRTKALQ